MQGHEYNWTKFLLTWYQGQPCFQFPIICYSFLPETSSEWPFLCIFLSTFCSQPLRYSLKVRISLQLSSSSEPSPESLLIVHLWQCRLLKHMLQNSSSLYQFQPIHIVRYLSKQHPYFFVPISAFICSGCHNKMP